MHACSCQRGGAAAAPRVAGGRLPSAAGSSSKKAPSCVRPCACCRAPRDTQHTRHLVLGELRWLSFRWAEALLKIARMTLTIKRDGNWSSFQLANSALPLSVTSSAIAPSARMESLVSSLAHAPAHLRAPVLHASSVSVHKINSGRTLYSCLRPCPSETRALHTNTGQQTKARGGTN